jgi:hypothetical protein
VEYDNQLAQNFYFYHESPIINSMTTITQRTKWRKRATSIMLNSIQNLLTPALNISISALVIRLASRELWGEFVSALITAQLIAHILAWGNKEYLLRQFSQHPQTIPQAWREVFISRFAVFLLICPVLLFLNGGLYIVWIAPLMIAQSFEVLIVYRRGFAYAVFAEMTITGGMLTALLLGNITQDRLFAVFIIGAWCKAGLYAWRFREVWLNYNAPPSPTLPPLHRGREQNIPPLHEMGRGLGGGDENMRTTRMSSKWTRYIVSLRPFYRGREQKIPPLHEMGRGLEGGAKIDFAYFRLALPFFLLGLSGMLASRIDLYTLSALAPKSDVAAYQVVINLLLYIQAGANFILIPFVKTIYRLDEATIRKMAIRLFLAGCVIIPPALILLRWLIGVVYDLTYADAFWLMGGLFVLPIFGYLPIIHRLYGQNAQNFVLWVNIAGAIGNGVLNLMLIPPLGILGALTASAISQWVMLVAYVFRNLRSYNNSLQ